MFYTSGRTELGGATYAAQLAVERRFRLFAINRTGLVWDTRFVPPGRVRIEERSALYLLLDGWTRWFDGTTTTTVFAPALFHCPQSWIEGNAIDGRTLSSGGEPFRMVQITYDDPMRSTAERALVRMNPSPALIESGNRLLGATQQSGSACVAALLARYAEEGLIPTALANSVVDLEPRVFSRVWSAYSASFPALDPFPALKTLCSRVTLSTAQFARDLEAFLGTFAVQWGGWRKLTTDLRLRWVVLLLSTPLTIGEVAVAAGYGSHDALDAACRNAGLPAPREIRASLLATKLLMQQRTADEARVAI